MKLGIMGSGMIVNIALNVLKMLETVECTALWHRDVESDKANQLCEDFKIKNNYTDMDEFMKDDSFDTVYVGVINSLHYEYTKKALLAGKNVICEKPFMASSQQTKELVALAKEKHLFLFEAIMTRYSNSYQVIKENIPYLGNIKMIQCNYSQYSSRYTAYRQGTVLPAFDPKFAGGCLYDINVYCIHFVIDLFGKPNKVHYFPNMGPNGIDTSGVMIMDYGDFKAVCCGAKDSNSPSSYCIQGEDGYISIESRIGFAEAIKRVQNKEEPITLNAKDEPNIMGQEFKKIAGIIDSKDYELCYHYLDLTQDAMDVMTEARTQAGIEFEGGRV